jgi:hypothetical protein
VGISSSVVGELSQTESPSEPQADDSGSFRLTAQSTSSTWKQRNAAGGGLQEAIRGRRGVLCRVIESGRIRRGDRIEIDADGRPEEL